MKKYLCQERRAGYKANSHSGKGKKHDLKPQVKLKKKLLFKREGAKKKKQ